MANKKTKAAFAPVLPPGLEELLCGYQEHCRKNGLRESSIARYEKVCRRFLNNLACDGCTEVSQITSSRIVTACLALTSPGYLDPVRRFLRYCADSGQTDCDYSYIIPPYKRPQPMPSVYSADEIRRMEAAIDRDNPMGKRDYAIVLLATRLGLRLDDIRTMRFDELDFVKDTICLTQKKTLVELKLSIIPELKNALLDYIQNGRPDIDDAVFLISYPPYRQMGKGGVVSCFHRALHKAKIIRGNRGIGPRAFRSSLASSMVNDGIPYEAVRKVLGHIDANAISHYAKLDIERLRFYALPVPAATGAFADFLAGRPAR